MSAKIEVGQVYQYNKNGGEYEIAEINSDDDIVVKSTLKGSFFKTKVTKKDIEDKFTLVK